MNANKNLWNLVKISNCVKISSRTNKIITRSLRVHALFHLHCDTSKWVTLSELDQSSVDSNIFIKVLIFHTATSLM